MLKLALLFLTSIAWAGTYTTDLQLYKPATGDTNYVAPFATGMDTLDAAIPDKRVNKIAVFASSLTIVGPLTAHSSITANGGIYGDGSNLSGVLTSPATFYIVKQGEYLIAPATFTLPTGSYLTAPATFYVVQTSDYLVAPATFTYARETHAHSYLTAPATFQILTPAEVIPSSATGYYGIYVASANYAGHSNTSTLAQAAVSLNNEPSACAAGSYVTDISSMGVLTCGTPAGSGDAILAATQTFSGANTFTGSVRVSSLTIVGGGITGVSNSSSTIFTTQFQTTQTSFINCVTGSTLTITTTGGRVMVGLANHCNSSAAYGICEVSYKIDGVSISSNSITNFQNDNTSNVTGNVSFTHLTDTLTAGSHSFCLDFKTNSATPGTSTLGTILNNRNGRGQFWVQELR